MSTIDSGTATQRELMQPRREWRGARTEEDFLRSVSCNRRRRIGSALSGMWHATERVASPTYWFHRKPVASTVVVAGAAALLVVAVWGLLRPKKSWRRRTSAHSALGTVLRVVRVALESWVSSALLRLIADKGSTGQQVQPRGVPPAAQAAGPETIA